MWQRRVHRKFCAFSKLRTSAAVNTLRCTTPGDRNAQYPGSHNILP